MCKIKIVLIDRQKNLDYALVRSRAEIEPNKLHLIKRLIEIQNPQRTRSQTRSKLNQKSIHKKDVAMANYNL